MVWASKLGPAADSLDVVQGELSDGDRVASVIAGADAVISALGPSLSPWATGTPVTDGTRAIVDAMTAAGVRRYVGIATPSVADERDAPTFTGWFLPGLARLTMPHAFVEVVGMTEIVSRSDLDWTIARITNPVDRRAKGTVRAGFLGRDQVGWTMTRLDIAAFLVNQLFDKTYIRAAPVISN